MGVRLQNVSADSGLHNFIYKFIGKMQAEDYNFRVWKPFANLPRCLQTVQLRHADIHHHYFWFCLQCQCDSFAASLRFATDFPNAAFEQKLAQPRSNDIMVVRNKNWWCGFALPAME